MRVVRSLIAGAAVIGAMTATEAAARDIRVSVDQAFPIRLTEAAEGVAIGNPSIAGVSVQNEQFLFVTGRSYGSTNLVILGSGGRVLYSGRIVVTADETDAVMVYRAGEPQRMQCAPECRPRPDIGDGDASQEVTNQISERAAAARR